MAKFTAKFVSKSTPSRAGSKPATFKLTKYQSTPIKRLNPNKVAVK